MMFVVVIVVGDDEIKGLCLFKCCNFLMYYVFTTTNYRYGTLFFLLLLLWIFCLFLKPS